MKWMCEKCGLSVDDKRVPNDCEGIKGQRHEWEETWWVLKKRKGERWQCWLKSSEGIKWENEHEQIKGKIKEDVNKLQKEFINSYNTGKEYYDSISKYYDKYSELYKIKEKEGEKFYKIKEKESEEFYKIKEREADKKRNKRRILFLVLALFGFLFFCFIVSNIIIAIILIVIIYIIGSISRYKIYKKASDEVKLFKEKASDEIKLFKEKAFDEMKEFKENYFGDDSKKKIYNFLDGKELPEAGEIYIKKITEIYEQGIKQIINKGRQMFQKNNTSFNVNNFYKFDEYGDGEYFYELDNDFDEDEFREDIINDEYFANNIEDPWNISFEKNDITWGKKR